MIWLSRAKHALSFTAQDWLLMAEGWLTLWGAWVAIRRWPLPKILSQLQRAARDDKSPIRHEPIVQAVQRAACLQFIPMLCLPQSVAICWMLVRRGQSCQLVIGARPTEGQLDAHAWVERDGIPINSPLDSAENHPVLLREVIGAIA